MGRDRRSHERFVRPAHAIRVAAEMMTRVAAIWTKVLSGQVDESMYDSSTVLPTSALLGYIRRTSSGRTAVRKMMIWIWWYTMAVIVAVTERGLMGTNT